MSFEMFSSTVIALEECNKAPHNLDIVDELWNKIHNPELNSFVEALKVQYSQKPREYRLILQDIAAQILNLRRVIFMRNVSEVKTFSKSCTRKRSHPINEVFNTEGNVFIGNYPVSRWFDEDDKKYHKDIMEARKRNPRTMNKREQNRD